MALPAEHIESATIAVELFDSNGPLHLECGLDFAPVTVAYETYGRLNKKGTNAIHVCHALTANTHAAGTPPQPGWWDGLIGPGKAFDTDKYFVVCSNILGSCYGTTGPSTFNPKARQPYRASFPAITVRDIVRVQKRLLEILGVRQLVTVCGSSLGGMQVLEWGIMYPDFCRTIIPISTSSKQSAWCIALNTIARTAIMGDPDWNEGNYTDQPRRGLSMARMVGMVSYRSPEELEQRFGRERQGGNAFDFSNQFQVESYLAYQGQKLVERFDANTYITLSRAMDLHDVGRGRGETRDVLKSIKARTLCIGVSSDIRYPTREQKELVTLIPDARYDEVQSIHGHDAFLIEFEHLNRIIHHFLTEAGV